MATTKFKQGSRNAKKRANPKSLRKEIGVTMTKAEAVDQSLVNRLVRQKTNRRARINTIKETNKARGAAEAMKFATPPIQKVATKLPKRGKVAAVLAVSTAAVAMLSTMGNAPKMSEKQSSGPSKRPSRWKGVPATQATKEPVAKAPSSKPSLKPSAQPKSTIQAATVIAPTRKADPAAAIAAFEAQLKRKGVVGIAGYGKLK